MSLQRSKYGGMSCKKQKNNDKGDAKGRREIEGRRKMIERSRRKLILMLC